MKNAHSEKCYQCANLLLANRVTGNVIYIKSKKTETEVCDSCYKDFTATWDRLTSDKARASLFFNIIGVMSFNSMEIKRKMRILKNAKEPSKS